VSVSLFFTEVNEVLALFLSCSTFCLLYTYVCCVILWSVFFLSRSRKNVNIFGKVFPNLHPRPEKSIQNRVELQHFPPIVQCTLHSLPIVKGIFLLKVTLQLVRSLPRVITAQFCRKIKMNSTFKVIFYIYFN
jgi:hypothetical protein